GGAAIWCVDRTQDAGHLACRTVASALKTPTAAASSTGGSASIWEIKQEIAAIDGRKGQSHVLHPNLAGLAVGRSRCTRCGGRVREGACGGTRSNGSEQGIGSSFAGGAPS